MIRINTFSADFFNLSNILITIELLILLFLAFINDLRCSKIKNSLNLIFILLGLITNLVFGGFSSFLASLVGVIIPLVFLIPLYVLKTLGAGDIKLFSAVGAICGYRILLKSIAFSFLAGGVIALFLMLYRNNLKYRFGYFIQYTLNCFLTISIKPYYTTLDVNSNGRNNVDSKSTFPFAIAIFIGTMLTWTYCMMN